MFGRNGKEYVIDNWMMQIGRILFCRIRPNPLNPHHQRFNHKFFVSIRLYSR